jgi:hypothetical protein
MLSQSLPVNWLCCQTVQPLHVDSAHGHFRRKGKKVSAISMSKQMATSIAAYYTVLGQNPSVPHASTIPDILLNTLGDKNRKEYQRHKRFNGKPWGPFVWASDIMRFWFLTTDFIFVHCRNCACVCVWANRQINEYIFLYDELTSFN